MIFEFYDTHKVGVLLNFFDDIIKSKTQFIDYKNDDDQSKRFYFGHNGAIFCVIIQPNDEIKITYKSSGGPPSGEFHHHINVNAKSTEKELKSFLIKIMRDHKIKSII